VPNHRPLLVTFDGKYTLRFILSKFLSFLTVYSCQHSDRPIHSDSAPLGVSGFRWKRSKGGRARWWIYLPWTGECEIRCPSIGTFFFLNFACAFVAHLKFQRLGFTPLVFHVPSKYLMSYSCKISEGRVDHLASGVVIAEVGMGWFAYYAEVVSSFHSPCTLDTSQDNKKESRIIIMNNWAVASIVLKKCSSA